MSAQLSLSIALQAHTTFANYYTETQEAVLEQLRLSAQGMGEQFLYCYGPIGVGRSHLLQACCHFAAPRSVLYLPLKNHAEFSPELLEGLEQLDLICLDDVDTVMGQLVWEEALFHLYNRLRDCGAHLIVSAAKPPQQLVTVLADLKSRLSWGLVLKLEELTDEEKIRALQLRAHERGLELSNEAAHFLLNHCPRDMQHLFESLEKLDQASLVAQRKLTIPFIKTVL